MDVAITGANGLIGAHLARALLREGHRVIAVVRSSSNLAALARLPVECRVADVLVPGTLAQAIAGAEIVFHAAAHFAYAGHSPEALERTAVLGTRNVLDAARAAGARRVVVTSSSVVVGASAQSDVRDEATAIDPAADEAAYVHAKIAQERLAFAHGEAIGLDVVATCPTISVGPHAVSLGPSNAVITTFLGDPFRLTYPGGCNLVAAADVARGHILVARHGRRGERYLLGGENLEWSRIHAMVAELAGVAAPELVANHTVCMLAAAAEEGLARLAGRAPATTREQARMVGRFYWYSHAKAASLGYSPRPARRALAEAIAFLAASPLVSRELRARLSLSREVYAARRALALEEAELRAVA